jgi:hypothetical protein
MKNIHLNKQLFMRSRATASHLFSALPYQVLVEWFLAVRLIILVLMSILALALLVFLLYIDAGTPETTGATQPPKLNTQLVDELEVWLEERQTEREEVVVKGSRKYFKDSL